MSKTLEQLITEYKAPYLEAERIRKLDEDYRARTGINPHNLGWRKRAELGLPDFPSFLIWDELDDRLIQIVTAIYNQGFNVSRFIVKNDKTYLIQLAPKHIRRIEAVQRIDQAIGDDWNSIKFSKNAIWLRGKLT